MKHLEKVTYVCPKCGAPFRSEKSLRAHKNGASRNVAHGWRPTPIVTKRNGPIGWKPFVEWAWVGLDAQARPWVAWRL